jgi:hypothetical protein
MTKDEYENWCREVWRDQAVTWGAARFAERERIALRNTARRMYEAGVRGFTVGDVRGNARRGRP